MLELEEICDANLSVYRSFENDFDSELWQYQSRIHPKPNAEWLRWYYIKYEGRYIGSVWLEKNENTAYAVLGIFIADGTCRNKGLGKEAICKILSDNAGNLPVSEIRLHVRAQNTRAIRCYVSSGFQAVRKYKKESGVDVIEMSYRL